jgi:hypothetical protein
VMLGLSGYRYGLAANESSYYSVLDRNILAVEGVSNGLSLVCNREGCLDGGGSTDLKLGNVCNRKSAVIYGLCGYRYGKGCLVMLGRCGYRYGAGSNCGYLVVCNGNIIATKRVGNCRRFLTEGWVEVLGLTLLKRNVCNSKRAVIGYGRLFGRSTRSKSKPHTQSQNQARK